MVGDAFLSKVFSQSCKTLLLFVKAIGFPCPMTKEKCDSGMFCLEVVNIRLPVDLAMFSWQTHS